MVVDLKNWHSQSETGLVICDGGIITKPAARGYTAASNSIPVTLPNVPDNWLDTPSHI